MKNSLVFTRPTCTEVVATVLPAAVFLLSFHAMRHYGFDDHATFEQAVEITFVSALLGMAAAYFGGMIFKNDACIDAVPIFGIAMFVNAFLLTYFSQPIYTWDDFIAAMFFSVVAGLGTLFIAFIVLIVIAFASRS